MADGSARADGRRPIASHLEQGFTKVHDDRGQRTHVDRKIEIEALIGPVRQIRDEDEVTRAADRQELGNTLNDRENDDL
jgi:hypothetical protein